MINEGEWASRERWSYSEHYKYLDISRRLIGLSRVWRIRDLGRLSMLYTAYEHELRPYEPNVYIYIPLFIYKCDDMNTCYLLLIIRCALVLFWGWRLSTERVVAQPLHLLLFPQVWPLLVACRLYCNVQLLQSVYMPFRLSHVNWAM